MTVSDVHVLLESEYVPRWYADSLQRMVEETDVTVSRLVVNAESRERSVVAKARRFVDLGLWGPVAAYKTLVEPTPEFKQQVHVSDVPATADADIYRTHPEPRDGLGQELPDDAVAVLSGADVALRAGFGILMGEALTAPERGVLSFHHGDLREYRGQPAGFWEFVNGESEAGVTVQRLTETLDGGEIVALKRVSIEGAGSWRAVQRRLYAASTDMLARAVANVADESVSAETPGELGDLYTLPAGADVVRYLVRRALA